MHKAQFLCLAKSWKKGGYCIAGKRFKNKQVLDWIRPVSAHDEGGLSEDDCRYEDGGLPSMLDWIECGVSGHCPEGAQKENCPIDGARWVRYGSYRGPLDFVCDTPGFLWGTGCESPRGKNDRIAVEDAESFLRSLYFIKVPRAEVRVKKKWVKPYPKVSSRVYFVFHGVEYLLKLTDVDRCAFYNGCDEGIYELGRCYMTVSLSVPHKGYRYKLVAGLINR